MKNATNQTAMQQLHNWAVDKWSDPGKLISLLEVVEKIEEILIIEKEQIMKDYHNGFSDGNKLNPTPKHFSPMEYYEKNYNKKNK
jgi:hypothetical protein